MPAPRAVLDANAIWPPHLRDALLRLGDPALGLYEPLWSEEILQEMRRTVIANGHSTPERIDRTLGLMRGYFPESMVSSLHQVADRVSLPDPDDRHVVAAAIVGRADYLVTFNITDFPPESLPPGFEVVTPDRFLVQLYTDSPEDVTTALAEMVAGYRRAPQTFHELLLKLQVSGAETFTTLVGELEDLDDLEAQVHEFRHAAMEDQ